MAVFVDAGAVDHDPAAGEVGLGEGHRLSFGPVDVAVDFEFLLTVASRYEYESGNGCRQNIAKKLHDSVVLGEGFVPSADKINTYRRDCKEIWDFFVNFAKIYLPATNRHIIETQSRETIKTL